MVSMTVLGEVCSFSRGLTYKKSDEVALSNNAVLRANNITLEKGEINYDDIKYISDEIKIPDEKKVRKGSLLICTASGSKKHLGKVALIEQNINFAFGGFMGMLTPNERVDAKYLYWLTQTKQYSDFILGLSDGANINNLKFSQLKFFPVPLLSHNEQKRLVAILDEVFADIEQVRAKTEQNLKNARELFESYLQQVFSQRGEGWVKYLLGDICTFKHGFAFKGEYFCDKSEFLLLTPGNFFEEGGYRDRGQKQKYYDGVFPEEYLLNKGDLIVAMTEQAAGLLGSPALIPEDGTFLHNQRLGLVELTTDFLGSVKLEFLFHLFNTSYFRSKVQETASGVKVRHTSPKKMQAIPVWIPNDLNEQEAIASKLFEFKERSVELEKIYYGKLKQLDELKKSILQKAFSGELTKTFDNKTKQGALA